MHIVAQVQASLDFLTRISTLLMRMPSESTDDKKKKVRELREGGGGGRNEGTERQ